MAICDVCKEKLRRKEELHRLAIPEYRAMTGVWAWVPVRVCPGCVEAYDRDFLERLRLLAPQVLENDEPITQRVCLACGSVESDAPFRQVSKWTDAEGEPVRRATFYLCSDHADAVYIEGVVVSSNLAGRAREVVTELPLAGDDLLERVEGWRPGSDAGPEGAEDYREDLSEADAADAVEAFWAARPEGLEAQAAWLGPVRKDYRMRYRLDVVRDVADRRETRVVLRARPEAFAVYRVVEDRREGPGP